MDDDEVAVAMLWYWRRKRRRNISERKFWVHPIVAERFSVGTFNNLIGELRSDEIKFFNYFRMCSASFDDLLTRVSRCLPYRRTKFRECICPEERLSIFLRYLASGCSFKELHYNYRVGVSTISKIIKEMSSIIWNTLCEEYIILPDSEEKWETIASGFERKANFPHCLVAVDGKHIRVKKPNSSGSMYFNYKDYFSFVLLAVVDSEYRFIYVSVGSYGKECDSSIFKESTFWKKFSDGSLHIPKPRPPHPSMEKELPYVLVGDEAFPLSGNLMRPFGGTHLNNNKRIFNYRLCRARKYVECAFGILANKWRILHRPLDVDPETAVQIVKACTALHNFVREKDGLNFETAEIPSATLPAQYSVQQPQLKISHGGPTANAVRSEFANYFISEVGSVSWQAVAAHTSQP